MTRTLKQNREENELREWLSEGLSQFSKDLSGENDLQKLTEKAVSFIGHYVNAGHGVIYLYDDENEAHLLNLMGSYMFTERANLSAHYKLGEGAIGQVALERKCILLTDIPKEKKITTGTTSATPLNTFTFPLIYEDVLCAVVEFSSYEPLRHLHNVSLTNQPTFLPLSSTPLYKVIKSPDS
ncbi:MAG: GAF domain-containing protein [Methylomarinum sp.]|nr:GAF domain-containing protein [Methylomarinum sp.]